MPDVLGDFGFTWPYYAAAIGGYILGSIPFGLLLTRAAGLGDIRAVGSGNIGATNVLRTGHKGLAAATLLLDAGKGGLAAGLGLVYGPDMAVLGGAGAIVGHVLPIWLGFRGGKGVATAIGVLLVVAWQVGLLVCLTWLVVAAATRYSSVAALTALAASPVYAWWLADPQRAELALFLAIVVWLRHWDNIRRLLRGEETRIGGGN